jgi:hypothetical protein
MPAKRALQPCLLALLLLVACSPAPESPGTDWRRIDWVEDYERGLAKAAEAGRPVFVYFTAAWCSWCHQYERDTLGDPRVKAALEERYVPVLVDFDGRPDLGERLHVRGLPYSAVLTAGGEMLLPIVGIVAPQDLVEVLAAAATHQPARADTEDLPVTTVHELGREGLETFRSAFLDHLDLLYDAEIGTLAAQFETGAGFKRPAPRSWRYLMQQGLWPDRVLRAARVEARRLRDPIDSGFFYFLDPHREDYLETSKLLETNAWLSAWFAEAGSIYRDEMLLEAARSGLGFLTDRLRNTQTGGFYQAQVADSAYYNLSPRERRSRPTPQIMQVQRSDTNAQAVIALVAIAEALENEDALRMARDALEFLLTRMYHQGRLYHIREAGQFGTLTDRPADLFWTLAAADSLASVQLSVPAREALRAIQTKASAWVDRQRTAPEITAEANELYGLVALVARENTDRFEPGTAEWALSNLRIEVETPPDQLIIGLSAWERWIKHLTAGNSQY